MFSPAEQASKQRDPPASTLLLALQWGGFDGFGWRRIRRPGNRNAVSSQIRRSRAFSSRRRLVSSSRDSEPFSVISGGRLTFLQGSPVRPQKRRQYRLG